MRESSYQSSKLKLQSPFQGGEKKVMKKSLSFLVAVALVFGLFASMASAADAGLTTEQKYQQFVDQKILKGDPSGDARLSANLTRAEFVTIADAINGLAEVTTTQTFSDVTKGQWFHGAIEAAAKAGLVNGIGQGKFGPKLNVTVEQAIKVFVISAGLKPVDGATVDGASAWAAPYIKAAQDAGFPVPANFKADATRGQAIDLAYAATVAKAVPTLSDVKAVANTDDTITVTGKVVGTADKVTVALGTADAVAATLSDGSFTYTSAAQSAGTYNVSVVAYDGTKSSAASTVSVTVEGFAVKSATVVGSNQIAVVFNKAAQVSAATTPANYVLTTGTTTNTVNQVKLSDDGLTATVIFGTAFAKDTYGQFTVEDVVSTSGKTLADYKTSIYLNDTTAPSVTGVTWSGTAAKITFSEPVASEGAVSINGVQYTAVATLPAAGDGVGYVTVADDTGSYVSAIQVNGWNKGDSATIDIVGLKDLSGNYGNDYNTTVTVPNDTTAPTVTNVTVNGALVTIGFSEALVAQSGVYATVNGTNVTAFDTDNNTITVDLSTTLGTSNFVSVELAIDAFKDLSGVAGTTTKKVVTLTLDKTAPVFQSAFISGNYIVLKYNEPVERAAAFDTDVKVTYTNTDGVVSTTPTTFTSSDGYDADNDTVVDTGENYYIKLDLTTVNAGKYSVSVKSGDVIDLSNNANAAAGVTAVVSKASSSGNAKLGLDFVTYPADDATNPDTNAPVQQDSTNPNVITVHLNETITAAQLVNANFLVGGKALPAGSTIQLYGDAKTVRIVLAPGAITVNGKRTVAIANLVSTSGDTVNSDISSYAPVLTENTAPKLVSAKLVSATEIDVTFSEKVTATAGSAVDGLEVWINGVKSTDSFTFAYLNADATDGLSNTAKLTPVGSTTFSATDKVEVKLVGADITDKFGTAIVDGSVTATLGL